MWRPFAHALDDLVSWKLRRSLFALRSHRTDPDALARMVGDLDSNDAASIFPTPPDLNESDARLEDDGRHLGHQTQVFALPSPHTSEVEENCHISGRVILPEGHKWQGPVVIMVHPWIGPGTKMMIRLFGKRLLRKGIGIVAPHLPHHFRRRHPETWDGELSICGDLCSVLASARQAVADLRRLNQWVRCRGAARVGLLGYSLGGAVVALTVTADSNFDSAVALVPPTDAAQALQRSSLTKGPIRDDIHASNIGDDLFAKACEMMSPLIHPALLPSDRLLVVGANHDRIVPVEIPERLAAHWQCELWREPQSHISLFQSIGARRRVADWTAAKLRG